MFSLIALPSVASATFLYDGEELYVQAGLDANFDVGVEASTTTNVENERENGTTGDSDDSSGARSSSTVTSDAELVLYGEALQQADANVGRAEASTDGEIRVEYYYPVRLFGVFQVRAKSETTVELGKSGMLQVRTRMPWWSVAATGTGTVPASVDSALSNSGEIITDMKFRGDAAARARVLEAVVAAHKSAALRLAGS